MATGCGSTAARSTGLGRRPIAAPKDCRFTQKGNRLYLHIFNWPFRHLHLDGLAGKVKYAQLLHDASEVDWLSPVAEVDSNIGVVVPEGMITLELPVRKPDVTVPVVELILADRHANGLPRIAS